MPIKFFKHYLARPLVRDTLTTTGWSSLGKGAGFIIPFFIAAWFGANKETDAFFFAYGILLFVCGIFAPVVENLIVPYITEARAKNENISQFVSSILAISSFFIVAISVIILIFTKPLLAIITNFDRQSLNLVHKILLEISPLILFLIWTSILAGVLNAYKKFTFPALSPAFRALINLIFIYCFKDIYNIHAIPLGYIAGELFRCVILFFIVRKLNLFELRLNFHFGKKIRGFSKTASYHIAALIAIGLNPFIDKSMASWLGEGSITILHYADRLYIIPVTFILSGFMVTTLSHLSEIYNREGVQKLNNQINKITKISIFFTLPIMVFLIFFRHPIINIILGHGQFTHVLNLEIAAVWFCYLLGLSPFIVASILGQAHMILKNTKPLFYLSVLNCFFNILFNYLLMHKYQTAGIALSTSLSSLLTAFSLKWSYNRITVKIV